MKLIRVKEQKLKAMGNHWLRLGEMLDESETTKCSKKKHFKLSKYFR